MAASNIFNEVLERVRAVNGRLIASGMLPAGIDQSRVIVEPPRDPNHGDMATNAAMVLAKEAGRKPRELAQAIAEGLAADDLVQKVDVAGPGFINITLKPAAWTEALRGRGLTCHGCLLRGLGESSIRRLFCAVDSIEDVL